MKLIHPYPQRGNIKEFYLKELDLNKAQKHIYLYYEIDGKNYMKQVPYMEAKEIIESLKN